MEENRELLESVFAPGSLELLEHPERGLYAALEDGGKCWESRNGNICPSCWAKVKTSLKTLKSLRPVA